MLTQKKIKKTATNQWIHKNLLSVPEFSKLANSGVGISTAAVYQSIDSGKITCLYIGKGKKAFIDPVYLKIEFRKNK